MMKQATRWSFILTAIVTLFIIVFLRWQGASLTKPATPLGILALEFANTPDKLAPVLQSWMGSSVANINICLDFLFIAAYTNFFLLAIGKASRQWQSGFSKQIRNTLCWLALLAAVLDIIENLLMLQTLNNQYNNFSLQVTWYCAFMKFSIVLLILIYLLVSIILILLGKKKVHGKESLENT